MGMPSCCSVVGLRARDTRRDGKQGWWGRTLQKAAFRLAGRQAAAAADCRTGWLTDGSQGRGEHLAKNSVGKVKHKTSCTCVYALGLLKSGRASVSGERLGQDKREQMMDVCWTQPPRIHRSGRHHEGVSDTVSQPYKRYMNHTDPTKGTDIAFLCVRGSDAAVNSHQSLSLWLNPS